MSLRKLIVIFIIARKIVSTLHQLHQFYKNNKKIY